MNLSQKPLAMAYVPWQTFENVLDAGCGLNQGTIFEDLIFPFVGSQAACQSMMRGPMPNQCPKEPPRPHPKKCGCETSNASYGRRCGY